MTDAATQPLGSIQRDGEEISLRFVRELAHPPEKVWRALTQSEHLRHWFPADIVGERRTGARVSLPFWPESVERAGAELEDAGIELDNPVLAGEILSWDPPRLFELMWDTERLRFELTADGDGTRLVLTIHVDERNVPVHRAATGYHVCLDALIELLDTGTASHPATRYVADLEQRYAER